MSIFLSLFLYFIVTVIINLRLFNEIRLSRFVILFFTTITSMNILVVQALHFVRDLNNLVLFLIVQLIICLLVVFFFIDPFAKVFKSKLPRFRVSVDRPTWLEGVLLFLIIIVLGLAFYIGTLSPINNSDSLHTHLPRIFYWLQHGSLDNWFPTAVQQISYPINITLQGLWLFLLSGSEMYFFGSMWMALVAIAASIYEIALLLGAEKKGALTAGIISLSFPVVLLQTYSYQGDAFVAALILCSVYFLLRFYKEEKQQDLYLSILVFAVGLGSKQTALLFIPVYVIALLLMLRKSFSMRRLLTLILLGVIFFGIFSSFKTIQNLTETRVEDVHMIGPGYVENLFNIKQKPLQGFLTTAYRYLYQAISLDGITGQLKLDLENIKENLFKTLTEKQGIDLESGEYLREDEEGSFKYDRYWPINEDGSWFGFFSFTFLPLAMILTIFQRKSRFRKWYLLLSVILLFLFIFGQIVLKGDGWRAYRGRHMTIAVLTLAPLFVSLIPGKRVLANLICLVLSLSAFYLSISVLLINDNRPIITSASLYTFHTKHIAPKKVTNLISAQYVSRSEKAINALLLTSPNRTSILESDYYEKLFYQDASQIEVIKFVNQNIAPGEPLYTYFETSPLEYALFGINRTRALLPLEFPQDLPPSNCALIANNLLQEVPVSFVRLDQIGEYSIYCNRPSSDQK